MALLPQLRTNSITGLLYRPGTETPFVEELVAASWGNDDIRMESLLTEESKDGVDPDLVRPSMMHKAMCTAMVTFLTKAEVDPSDKDLVRRPDIYGRAQAAVETTLTRSDADQSDRDLIRS
jgi:hypothetical protein